MALASFFGNRFGSVRDPLSWPGSGALWDQEPARSFAEDARAIANTRVDWLENADSHVFKADLPGLKKEEVKVLVEDGHTLQISGERKIEDVKDTDTWHRVERSQCKFLRRLRLPDNANVDEVTAKVDNGVLTVTVPKIQRQSEQQTRSIDIK